jgi:anti-sigma factor RsiW
MNCDFTEKISLLIDGELAHEETKGVETHLKTCAACRQAREDFLLVRREINSYESALDPFAQQRTLRNILASKSESEAGATKAALSSGILARLRERFAIPAPAFARLRPAVVAVLALLFIVFGVGLFRSLDTEEKQSVAEVATQPETVKDEKPAHVPDVVPEVKEKIVAENKSTSEAINEANNDAPVRDRNRLRRDREELLSASGRRRMNVNARPKAARVEPDRDAPVREAPSETFGTNLVTVAGVRPRESREAAHGDPQFEAARHVERAQLLLRSFRNARLTSKGDPTFNLTEEKQRSRRLLYRNILLRRDAATRGDAPVENLLSSVEPFLLDIANLPDRPAPADLRPIKERIDRKQIVAVLQVNSNIVSRSAN